MPRKPKIYSVHISDVQAFRKCRWAWDKSSPLRCNLTPMQKYAPFFVGSMVHHALEHWYKFAIPPREAIDSYIWINCSAQELNDPKIHEQANLAIGLVDHYLLWQKHDRTWLADNNFEFLAPEMEFSTPLWSNTRRKLLLDGTFDGVVKHLSTGHYYLWEIKTTRSLIEREKQLALDSQTDAYASSAQQVLGVPIHGIIYTLIRKKVPEAPKPLNNGSLERKASADTTAEWYLDYAVKYHKDSPNLKQFIDQIYSSYLDGLLQQPNKYFRRVIVQRSQPELTNARLELLATAMQMVDPRTPIYRTDGYHCNYCLFRDICIASKQGKNIEPMISQAFMQNPKFAALEED